MAQLIIFLSNPEAIPSVSERGQEYNFDGKKKKHSRSGKPLTPRIKNKQVRRVVNLPYYDPELGVDYAKFAQDLCADAGDKYYGHVIN